MASKYSDCIKIMCLIFDNLIRDSNIASYLSNLKVSKLIFSQFGRHCYHLLYELLDQCNISIDNITYNFHYKYYCSKRNFIFI